MKVSNTAKWNSWADARKRKRSGNVMVLVAAITVGIIIAVILFALDYNQFLGASHQHLTAVESAGLAAVQDLSRIVIRDNNYGFIALTDYPPIGKKTLAGDGRPLPVTSVNTIVGTARLDLIIANRIASPTMVKLAEMEADNANASARLLTECLKNALAQSEAGPTGTAEIAGSKDTDPKSGPWTDMDGVLINPFSTAKRVYMSNLTTMSNGGKPVVNSFKCSLGYVESGGSTLTRIPNPETLAQVNSNQKSGDFYKAFINIPAHGKDFYFAGVSSQPALIDARQFRPDDNKRVCSAVRVEAEHSFEKAESTTQQSFKTIACAEPSGSPDTSAPGVMTLAFPDGMVPGINTVRDLITNGDLSTKTGAVIEAKDGDWPLDGVAKLLDGITIGTPSGEDATPTAADMFVGGMFDWLRSAHARPNIAQVSSLMTINLHDALGGSAPPPPVAIRFDLIQPAIASDSTKKSNDTIVTGIMNLNSTDRLKDLLQRTPTGLKAYDAIANLTPISTLLPPNAAEVTVDQSGTVRSTSGKEIDSTFMGNYWTAVQNTQSAAFQTLAAAELGLLGAPGNTMLTNAKANAESAVKTTADLVENQHTYTIDGLSKNSDGSYQVGGSKFTPHPTPAANIAALLADNASSGEPSNKSWSTTPKDFKTFKPSESTANPDDSGTTITPKVLMVEFDVSGNVITTAIPASPFSGLPVSEGQTLGLVYNAIKTVGNLTWSAVARSQCHNPGKGKHGGQPLTGTPVDWCERSSYSFSTATAEAKGKGQKVLGLIVITPGSPPGVSGCGGSKSGGGSGSGKTKQVPLANNGEGPRSARAGTGEIKKDRVGYPWGFKGPNNANGELWTVGDVKYQFPGGQNELGKDDLLADDSGTSEGDCQNGSGNGNGWGGARNRLNSGGTLSKLGAGVSYPAATPVNPYGEQATFAPKGGGSLPQQPRANYYCGGMAFEFQLRGPIVTMGSGTGTSNGFKLSTGTGMAEVGGLPIRVPGLSAIIDVTSGSANSGVLGLNDAAFTKTIPDEPSGI